MGGDLTAALFSGPGLRGGGPGPFVQRCTPDIVLGQGIGDLVLETLAAGEAADARSDLLNAR